MPKVYVLSDPHLNLECSQKLIDSYKEKDLTNPVILKDYYKATKDMSFYGREWDDHITKLERNWDSIVNDDDYVIIPGDISTDAHDNTNNLEWLNRRKGIKIIGEGNHDQYWWPSKASKKKELELKYKNIHFVDMKTTYEDDHMIIAGTRFCDFTYNNWPVIQPDLSYCKISIKFDEKCQKTMKDRVSTLCKNLRELKEKNPTKKVILMLHHPPYNIHANQSEISQMIECSNIDYCLFGHIHTFGRMYFNKEITFEKLKELYKGIDHKINSTQCICASSDLLQYKPLLLFDC